LGIYDIVFRKYANDISTIYMTFDSNLNTVNIEQTLTSFVPGFYFSSSSIISKNGQYLLVIDQAISLMILYAKISNKFTPIYNSSVLSYDILDASYFVSDDGSIAVALKGFKVNFVFTCGVANC